MGAGFLAKDRVTYQRGNFKGTGSLKSTRPSLKHSQRRASRKPRRPFIYNTKRAFKCYSNLPKQAIVK